MSEELLVLLVMAGIMAISAILTKNNLKLAVGFLLVASAAGSLAAGMGVRIREIVEGPFGFLDPALAVLFGMIFVKAIYDNGSLARLFDRLVLPAKCTTCRAFALLLFTAIPGMLTGTASASILTAGAIAAPYLKKQGVSDKKALAFLSVGAFLGMLLPPINLPAMVTSYGAGSVEPTPFVGFFLPLLIIGVPAFVVYALIAGKTVLKDTKPEENAKGGFDLSMIPLLAVAVLSIQDAFAAKLLYIGYPVIFAIGTVLAFVFPAEKKQGAFKEKLLSGLTTLRDGAAALVPEIALTFALGSFIEISSMTGVRGAYNTLIIDWPVTLVLVIGMLLCVILGVFLSVPLPAFVLCYASFLIGWFGSAVQLAGMSVALCLAYLLAFRGGLVGHTAERLGYRDAGYRDVWKDLLVPAGLVLVMGLLLTVFAGSLDFLII